MNSIYISPMKIVTVDLFFQDDSEKHFENVTEVVFELETTKIVLNNNQKYFYPSAWIKIMEVM